MTTPRPGRPGAYSHGRRRGGVPWWLWSLLLLLLALIVAGVVALVVRDHRHHDAAAASPATASSAPASVQTTAAVTPTASAPLAGGGGVAPTPGTGSDAAAGVVGTVLFASNSAAVDADGERVITAAAAALRADAVTRVTVTGFTDTVAGAPTNDPLSQERADAVAARLRSMLPGVTVTAGARGQADPFATNATVAGRAQNRRAVITGS